MMRGVLVCGTLLCNFIPFTLNFFLTFFLLLLCSLPHCGVSGFLLYYCIACILGLLLGILFFLLLKITCASIFLCHLATFFCFCQLTGPYLSLSPFGVLLDGTHPLSQGSYSISSLWHIALSSHPSATVPA